MELTWSESYLIAALRVLMPFFRNHGFHLSNLEYGFIDGDYLKFKKSVTSDIQIEIIYNPGFDMVIYKKSGPNLLGRAKRISLVEAKEQYSAFSHLPNNYEGEEGLKNILKEYTLFLDTHFLSD